MIGMSFQNRSPIYHESATRSMQGLIDFISPWQAHVPDITSHEGTICRNDLPLAASTQRCLPYQYLELKISAVPRAGFRLTFRDLDERPRCSSFDSHTLFIICYKGCKLRKIILSSRSGFLTSSHAYVFIPWISITQDRIRPHYRIETIFHNHIFSQDM
jgi:hypothetical protein